MKGIHAGLLVDVLGGCRWLGLGVRAPFSAWWSIGGCARGENASPQSLVSGTGISGPSHMRDQSLFLCLRLQSAPHIYAICVQAVGLSGSTSLQSFTSHGTVFHNPRLQGPLRLRTALILWGGSRHALAILTCLRKCSRDCAASEAQSFW